jgi:hypothetical protein
MNMTRQEIIAHVFQVATLIISAKIYFKTLENVLMLKFLSYTAYSHIK